MPLVRRATLANRAHRGPADWRGLADPVFVGAGPGRASSAAGDERYTFGSNLTVKGGWVPGREVGGVAP